MNRLAANPLYNKLAFNGYHIEGQFDNSIDGCWDDYHDHYPTLEAYYASFSFTPDVLSPREIYLTKNDPSSGERNLVIRDNNGVILWDDTKEAAFNAISK